jgi:GT2 family glycosyltransferase
VTVPVTVLVCTRDRPALLDRCLRALLDGDERPHELLVVDQSREPTTREVVRRLSRVPNGQCLRYVRHDGQGLSASQNHGFRTASCEVVLVTDDDAVPASDWVATGWRLFRDDPDLALVGGRVEALGPDGEGLFPVSTRTATTSRRLDRDALPWDVGSGNCFGLRRADAVREGNDERLGPGAPFLGGADMDLFRRVLRSSDGHGLYTPELLVLHERADRQGRLDRRVPYGYGMGAACSLWWRQGDRTASRILLAWLRLRTTRLRDGIRQRDGLRVHEEVLVLAGTVRGLVRGHLARPADPLRTDGG